jgi:multiple sugar transport system permease protein
VSGDALRLPLARNGRTSSTRARPIGLGISRLGVTLFTASLAMIFLLPLGYMILTSVKDNSQITALNAPLWPASPQTYATADGQVYQLYSVPLPDGTTQDLALEKPGRIKSTFIDPTTGQEVSWQGNWRGLSPVWSSISPKFDNFTTVLDILDFPLLLRNTLVVAVLGTIGAVSSAVLVAYGFARFRIPGRNGLFLVMIMTIMLPFQVLLIPQYIGFRAIGWTGTWLPLIVPQFFANAYNVFLLRQYFLTLPRELDQAAQVDGASPLRILWSVIIPQAWPAIIAVSLFHFFFAWNDFFAPLVYLSGHPELATMTVGLQAFSATYAASGTGYLTQAGALMAMILPVAIFFAAQRVFMRGVVISGVEK